MIYSGSSRTVFKLTGISQKCLELFEGYSTERTVELIGIKRSGESAITHRECTRYMKNESIKREVGGCMKARNNELGSRLTAEQEGSGKQRSIDIIFRGGADV